MKKFLIFSIIFLASFTFITNVKGANAGGLQINSTMFDSLKPLSSYNNSNYDIETARQAVINKLNIVSTTDDYLLVAYNHMLYGYKWKKDASFEYKPALTFGSYNNSTTSNYLYLRFAFKSNNSDITSVNYNMETSAINSSSVSNINTAGQTIINGAKVINGSVDSTTGTKYNIFFESSFDVSYNNFGFLSGSNRYYYNPITICDDSLCYQFYEGDILLKANGDLNIGPVIPEINITNKEKTENYETININFSLFDTEKYLYFYRTSLDNNTWIEINQNDFNYTSYNNSTLYVTAIDKEKYVESAENGEQLVYDVVASATYVFNGLEETIPEISFVTNIPDVCYLTTSDKESVTCKSLTINILNDYSTDKYLWEYSTDNTNFTNIYTDSFTNVYSENTTLYFRLLNRETNEYIKYVTYTLDGITIPSSELGPYIKLSGNYNKEKYFYEINAIFYNYDSTQYNYFYTLNKNNWNEITTSQLQIYANNIYKKTFNIYQDCTFIIKIEDKNGNYIKSYSFTIKLEDYDNPQGLLQIFKNMGHINEVISEYINNIYTSMRSSKIGEYIFIIIVGSIIILLIKAMRN